MYNIIASVIIILFLFRGLIKIRIFTINKTINPASPLIPLSNSGFPPATIIIPREALPLITPWKNAAGNIERDLIVIKDKIGDRSIQNIAIITTPKIGVLG